MNATTAFLCITTLSLVSLTIPAHSQTNAASVSEGGSASHGGRETERPAMPRKADSDVTRGGMSSAGKPKQIPAPLDRSQVVEERLRSGQMEKPIAQGEVSDRLNQLYSGSNSQVSRESR